MIFDVAGPAGGATAGPDLEIPELPEDLHRELYRLAYEVRELAPWERFVDHEWFGIVDPDSGETGIVSILGAGGQVFAVQFYLPEEGIRFWNKVNATGIPDHNLALFDQRMIECEFSEREDLPEEDQEFNERYPPVGSRARRVGYVCLRAYRPAHYPWFPEEEEARKLEIALRLVAPFCAHMKRHAEKYYRLEELLPVIPIFRLREGGDRGKTADWEIRPGSFPVAEPKRVPDPPRDDVFHARMDRLAVEPGTTWETGSFFLPTPVVSGGRPVYASMTLTMALDGAVVPVPLMGLPEDCRMELLRRSFAALAEDRGCLPETLVVASPTAEAAFAELAEKKGVTIKPVEVLSRLGEFATGLAKYMAKGAGHDLGALLGGEHEPAAGPDLVADYVAPSSARRYVMRIDLAGAKPPIWRRLSVPVDASFFDLHVAIQDAMGWEDCHLHLFEVRKGRRRVMTIELENPDEGPFGGFESSQTLPELTTTLEEVVGRGHKQIRYLYDFGDDWDHIIKIEKTEEGAAGDSLPKVLGGRGACPIEDCGGIWGWQAILEGNPGFPECWDKEELEELRNAKFEKSQVVFSSPGDWLARLRVMRQI